MTANFESDFVPKNTVITAPAGSGKTKTLVDIFVNLVEMGHEIDDIVAITFTNMAAGEMQERILDMLHNQKKEIFRNEYLRKNSRFRISTIHSFLRSILYILDPYTDYGDKMINESQENYYFKTFLGERITDLLTSTQHLKKLRQSKVREMLQVMQKAAPVSFVWALITLKEDDSNDPARVFLKEAAEVFLKIFEEFQAWKLKKGFFSYSDIEYYAYKSVLGFTDQLKATDLLLAFNEKINAILVDEFQDTSQIQWDIIKTLAEDWLSGQGLREVTTQAIYLIGDPKQSIYSFRGTDVSIMQERVKEFQKMRETEEGAAHFEVKRLQTNYRSLPVIVEFVNDIFPGLFMKADESAEFPWTTDYEAFEPAREDTQNAGAVFKVILKKDGEKDLKAREVSLSEAEFIAEEIKNIVGKEIIYEKNGSHNIARKVRYSDIAVLLRTLGEKSEIYEKAFLDRGIPFISVDRGYSSLKEFNFILDFFKLFSPLYGRAIITKLVNSAGYTGNYYRDIFELGQKAPEPLSRVYSAFIKFLEAFERSPYSAYTKAVKELEPVLIAMSDSPEQLEHSKRLFEEIFYAFEVRGVRSLREITDSLLNNLQDLLPELATEIDCVTVMSIHKSKGLEFPVVFAGGISSKSQSNSFYFLPFAADRNSPYQKYSLYMSELKSDSFVEVDEALIKSLKRYHKEAKIFKSGVEEQEYMRLLYVAFTRARDRLYVLLPEVQNTATTKLYRAAAEKIKKSPYGKEIIFTLKEETEEEPQTLFEILKKQEIKARFEPGIDGYELKNLLERTGYSREKSLGRLRKEKPPSKKLEPSMSSSAIVIAGQLIHEVASEFIKGLREKEEIISALESKLSKFPSLSDISEEILSDAKGLLDRIESDYLKKAEDVFSEMRFIRILEDSFVEGRIDLLLREKDGKVLIVDFKYGRENDSSQDIYRDQLESYEEAAGIIFNTSDVSSKLEFVKNIRD